MMNNLKQAIYETAQDLHSAGIINDERMTKYNKLNVPVIHQFKPEELKQLRLNENVSQSMLAAYLNISVSAIRKWETGEKKLSGLALRLLNLIEKKDYWHSLIKKVSLELIIAERIPDFYLKQNYRTQ